MIDMRCTDHMGGKMGSMGLNLLLLGVEENTSKATKIHIYIYIGK